MEVNEPIIKIYRKLHNKYELLELLKQYKAILSENAMDYLNSLISLDISAIKENVDKVGLDNLSELKIYKEIAKYNIYSRAKRLAENSGLDLKVIDKEIGINLGLNILPTVEYGKLSLFHYDYSEKEFANKKQIPNGYRTDGLGKIVLNQIKENTIARDKEIQDITNKLNTAYAEANPYNSNNDPSGRLAASWEKERIPRIELFRKRLIELNTKVDLDEQERAIIEVSHRFHNLLLEDYGLHDEDFTESKSNSNILLNGVRKTLVKEMKNITIENNIKYL